MDTEHDQQAQNVNEQIETTATESEVEVSLYTEAAMSDSFIYGLFNASGEIQTRILKALKEGIVLDKSYIEEQIIQIEKTRISPLVPKVMEAFNDGIIRLVYWKSATQKMTKSVPFVIHKSPNGPVVSIFVSSFGKLVADDLQLDIPMKNLYILMESAFLAFHFHTRPQVLTRNSQLMKITNEIYVNMFMRVLNRDYALSLDVSLHDKISFAISKFFLKRIWDIDNTDIINNIALQVTTEKKMEVLIPIAEEFDAKNVETIEDLFAFLKDISPRMNALTVRYFVERYLNTYGGSSVLCIDYLPYVIFAIDNTIVGGFLLNQNTLSDIVKNTRDIRKFWPELAKLV